MTGASAGSCGGATEYLPTTSLWRGILRPASLVPTQSALTGWFCIACMRDRAVQPLRERLPLMPLVQADSPCAAAGFMGGLHVCKALHSDCVANQNTWQACLLQERRCLQP